MPRFQSEWYPADDIVKPVDGEIVNVWARCGIDGVYRQFMAKYVSYKAGGKLRQSFIPLYGAHDFIHDSVTHWCPRLSSPWGGGWHYTENL